ncbi:MULTISPECIES: ABC transporter permease [Streptomyces]|uniref:Peptide ABC transporter permease n=1 Tax=Streptomyces cacaoi TaxID=1898 RepID=A0A4Y3R3H8_STRCI|nr:MULTISPECIES: ABC transporter permease [Streptomyces]NNG85249.1 ABC transporter permease [Streptomyces cacaoi]QHF97122.1 ABC transporter permease [Streptomyces sp. NHF165]GEB52064.1 peptide ABC transporter permease [Streptomyces cacaoi]
MTETLNAPAPASKEPGPGPAGADAKPAKGRSLWTDAWHDLRRKPLFIISAVLILLLLVMVAFPSWFTSASPTAADLTNHYQGKPEYSHFFGEDWFGYDTQGRSVWARMVYGARASVLVGVLVTLFVTILGGIVGLIAGYFGGWLDSVLSRITDIFQGIPFLLGAMVVLTTFTERSLWVVIAALLFLGWTQIARVARGAVITVKQSDYVHAAQSLGASTARIMFRHIVPNALAPVVVVATTALGGYIAAEATLSYLGIGLAEPTVSWGVDVDQGKDALRTAPHMIISPAVMVSLTVLAFIMLGDAVRNALDPKSR